MGAAVTRGAVRRAIPGGGTPSKDRCGPQHSSAVPFYDGPLWGQPLSDVHITRRDGLTGRKERGVRQHRGQLREDDVVAVHDFHISAPARTVLECATVGSIESALVVANDFLHRGW